MITNESRLSIDELETKTTEELIGLLSRVVTSGYVDYQYILDVLAVGCPIDGIDNNGATALHAAARNGRTRSMTFLIELGANLDVMDIWGQTPLHLAMHSGYLDIAAILVKSGANIYIKDVYNAQPWDIAGIWARNALPELNPYINP